MKAKVIPFRRNLNLSNFNVAPVEWRKIRTNEDKKLSSSEIELLWTIHRLAIHHNTDNLELSYSALSYACGLGVSQRQLNRYLHKLSATGIIKFYTRKSVVNYDKKLIIEIDFGILENLMTVKFDRQVCQSNMSGYNIDKNKLQSKEVGERAFSYLSPTSEKERNKNKKEKPSMSSLEQAGLLCYPEGAASQPCSTERKEHQLSTDCRQLNQIDQLETLEVSRTANSRNVVLDQSMGIPINTSNSTLQKTQIAKPTKVIALTPEQEREHYLNHQVRDVESQTEFAAIADILSFPNLIQPATCASSVHVEQLPTNEPQGEEAMKAYDWDNPGNKLDLAIAKNFDTITAQELTCEIDYCYIEVERKIRLVFKKKLAISEYNKSRLKQLIKDIYGNDTEIVYQAPITKKADVVKLLRTQEKFSSSEQNQSKNEDFSEKPLTQKVIKNLLEDGFDKALIVSWFNPIQLKKITEDESKITFECADFAANQIINKFQSSLMQSCKEFGLELIFLAKNRFDEIRTITIDEKGKF